jgi:tetratricopeptide (TPR) repeat protein
MERRFLIRWLSLIIPIVAVRVALLSCMLVVGCELRPIDPVAGAGIDRREITAVALVREGLQFASSGRMADAELKYVQARYLFPNAENIASNLAYAWERQGRFDEALAEYRRLYALHPESALLKKAIARTLLGMGDLTGALQHYGEILDELLAKDERVPAAEIARTIATIHYGRGSEENALCFYQLAHTIHAGDVEVLTLVRVLNSINLPELTKDLTSARVAGNAGDALDQEATLAKFSEQGQVSAAEVAKISGSTGKEQSLETALLEMLATESAVADKKVINNKMTAEEALREKIEAQEALLKRLGSDQRLIDPASFARVALYWPARFEFAVADFVKEKLPKEAPKSFLQNLLSKVQ